MKKGLILLAEDDTNLGFVVKDNLELAGYEVELYPDGEMALVAFGRKTFDLCILDVMMPKKDGFTTAQEIRKKNTEIPFIFVTAKSLKEDQIKGLKLGAEDYITKPFSIEVLMLKVENILKRTQKTEITPVPHKELFEIGKFILDFKNQTLTSTIDNHNEQMTQKEAELLRFFCVHKNNVIERNVILNTLWGDDDYFTGRSLDVFVSRLRKYLKADTNLEIANVHGVGFKLIENN
ncbi:MAG: DNA-binding response regulator [Bacteroidetes bacterium]|nr:MAG: DNA-binding response regulator [Bacteroidota bacterium]TAG90041.1 MAG: DNA-binding response regulator [Bacteroidota bacterium]